MFGIGITKMMHIRFKQIISAKFTTENLLVSCSDTFNMWLRMLQLYFWDNYVLTFTRFGFDLFDALTYMFHFR